MYLNLPNLTLDNIFEQVINGQTKAAQSMTERATNYRTRRLQQAMRTRLFFHELRPTFPGVADEIVTAYSDEFNQPLIMASGVSNMVTQLVRFSDTVTNKAWSQDPATIRIYAGLRPNLGLGNGQQRFSPQIIPAGARIAGDYKNVNIPGIGAQVGQSYHILAGHWIAPPSPPSTQQEQEALAAATAAINAGEPSRDMALPVSIALDGTAGQIKGAETRVSGQALLVTGITANFPASPTPANARLTISDSSTSGQWMKDFITWWGVAGQTLVFYNPIFYFPKPYYLPAGAILRVQFQNTLAADGAPIAAGTYNLSFICETP